MNAKPEPTYTNLTRTVYEKDMQGLFAAGEAVEQLLSHPGWQAVTRLVELHAADIEAKLSGHSGPLASRADYAHWTSRRAALRALPDAAHAIVAVAAKTRAEQQHKHEPAAEPAAR